MKRLKYAGLCAAGIALNMCCLVLDVFTVVRDTLIKAKRTKFSRASMRV